MAAKVRIVTDSTADLPPQVAKQWDIEVVPLNVIFGEHAYKDGVELSSTEFYKMLKTTRDLPKTSQPSVGLFEEVFGRLAALDETAGILCLALSSKLSGTYQAATIGSQAITNVPIEVIDSTLVSAGLALPVLAAAKAAAENKSMAEIKAIVLDVIARTRVLFVIDTLEFLQRGGRIGRARAFLGTLLSVKPILELRQGEVVPLEQVRTRNKAFERMKQLMIESQPLEDIMMAQNDETLAKTFLTTLTNFKTSPSLTVTVGAVVGTHAGPGTIGVALLKSK